MANINLFITGTDTNIGKTYFCVQLLQTCRLLGLRTVALKPLASDCTVTAAGLRNQDALNLQQAATEWLPYHWVNPIVLKPAIAPHIAALQAGIALSVESLIDAYLPINMPPVDIIVIEGCGGWLCPLNQHETMADFALALNVPIILVVGLRLGCLNHTILTWRELQRHKAPVVGWIANYLSPVMPFATENIDTLTHFLAMPPLAIVPYQQELSQIMQKEMIDKITSLPPLSINTPKNVVSPIST